VWLASQMHSGAMVATTATRLQQSHREWLLTLLAQGVPLSAIRRLNLDDPREPQVTRAEQVELYLKRKRRYHAND
jgi:hypothetical protein